MQFPPPPNAVLMLGIKGVFVKLNIAWGEGGGEGGGRKRNGFNY